MHKIKKYLIAFLSLILPFMLCASGGVRENEKVGTMFISAIYEFAFYLIPPLIVIFIIVLINRNLKKKIIRLLLDFFYLISCAFWVALILPSATNIKGRIVLMSAIPAIFVLTIYFVYKQIKIEKAYNKTDFPDSANASPEI